MYQYEAIKEIECDLLKRSYIKAPVDIDLHLSSRFDQYGLAFDDELQEADVKRRIIREVIKSRKEAEMRRKLKSNKKNKDIYNNKEKGKQTKSKRGRGKRILIVDLNEFKSKIFVSYKEAAKKSKISDTNIVNSMKENDIHYMKKKKLLLVKLENGVNEIILQNIDEIVETAREIYIKENESKYTDKISLQEAINLAIKIVEEKIKNE